MNERIIQQKRVVIAVLLVLLLSAIGMTKGYAVTIGNLNYSLNSYSMTATVTGHKDGTSATGNLIIPSSVTYGGQLYTVTEIVNWAFYNCSGFTGSLTIGNSVTVIGKYAFESCSGFTGSLTIGNSVTTIGNSAFYNCSGFTGSLTIPNSVTTIGSSAFRGCSGFTGSLTIGNSVTTIGNAAFYNCSGFTGDLTIPNSVTTIGDYAFYNCYGFTGSLTIPNSVTTIGNYAFYNCYGFTGSLTIPNSVTTIGNYAFYNCYGFTGSLTIPNSVTTIGSSAFRGCSGFTGSLTLPNSVTEIGDYAFSGCSGFTGSLTIGNSVTTIGSSAFRGCSGFTGSLTIPNSVTTIGEWAFYPCSGFTGSLTLPNSVTEIGDYAFSGCSGFTGSLTIPNSVTTIGSSAFSGCSGFTGSLTIPNSVTTIGSNAFRECSGFTGSLTIGNSVTTIGNAAFYNCYGFTGDLTIPNSVTVIGEKAFYNCYGFTGSLTIPNSVTVIGEKAFSYCSGFTGDLVIPNSVNEIGNYAFSGCSGFISITVLAETPPALGNGVFYGVFITIPVYVPCGYEEVYASLLWGGFYDFIGLCGGSVTVMADPEECGTVTGDGQFEAGQFCTVTAIANEGYAFTNWTFNGTVVSVEAEYAFYVPGNMTLVAHFVQDGNIVFADAIVKSICIANWDTNGDGELSYAEAAAVTDIGLVFYYNQTITSFEELQYFIGLTTICNYAFHNCSNLSGSLYIPNSVTEIGYGAFKGCSSLTGSLTIGNSVTSIGNEAFKGCIGFSGSLTIPNSVTSIGYSAFEGCSGFTSSLTISNSLTEIPSCAFYDCNGFTGSLIIPNSVTTIGGGAFRFCSGFTGSLIIPNSVTTIGYQAFEFCSGFTGNLTIGNSVTSIGDYAFQACGFTGSLIIPNSVTTIGVLAFNACHSFTGSLTISNSVTEIGDLAFQGCGGFTGSLTLSNSLTTIGFGTFNGCSGFTGTLNIPNSVTEIGYAAFQGCRSFNTIILPNSVTTIDTAAFYVCDGLTGVYYMGDIAQWCDISFAGWSSNPLSYAHNLYINNSLVTNLVIPETVTEIKVDAFYGCSCFVGDLVIPNSVNLIGGGAFGYCSGFTGSLTIPNSVTTIGDYAFINCSGFTGSLTIPNSVTEIGDYAFGWCGGFTSMTVLAETPPALGGGSVFSNVPKTIPVYVPCGSLSAYQNAEGWNEFTNIQEACDMFTVTATANPTNGGLVSGGGTYQSGQTCTLTAMANEGYSFVNWTENNEVVSTNANYSFTVSGNRTLVANFALSGTITNHWIPEGSSYSEIMAMYTVIQIDGVEQYSNTLEVGVFCGDECRGSAIASEFELTHRYLAVLNVFGENGHQLTFKLYDHSIGQELNLTSPATVTFDVNGYGNPVEPYVLNFTSSMTHSQALNNGWNWWSTYIEQNGIDGLGMLENSIGSAGVRIQGRNGTIDQFEYQGSSYWYGSLTSIENEQMYKIRTNAACNAVMVGYMAMPANHPITINGGWNWIGFPCSQSVSVNDAMSGFTPVANDVIKGRNGSTTYVSYGSTSLWYGTLNTLEPGQGYMYKSNSNISKTLIFQTGRGEETVTNVTEENSFFTPNTDDFSDNMLVTAVIDMDGQELRSEDYEIAAYVGNECRGSVRLMYVEPFDRYVAFLLVFGEAEEDIHFVLTDGNDMTWSDDLLTYATDGMEGSLTEPATLHFGTLGLNDNERDFVNVFPNPSNRVFNIEGNGIHKIEVVNAFGQTILLKEVENNLMQIDLGDKAAGVYLLRVITNNGITTKQIVKE